MFDVCGTFTSERNTDARFVRGDAATNKKSARRPARPAAQRAPKSRRNLRHPRGSTADVDCQAERVKLINSADVRRPLQLPVIFPTEGELGCLTPPPVGGISSVGLHSTAEPQQQQQQPQQQHQYDGGAAHVGPRQSATAPLLTVGVSRRLAREANRQRDVGIVAELGRNADRSPDYLIHASGGVIALDSSGDERDGEDDVDDDVGQEFDEEGGTAKDLYEEAETPISTAHRSTGAGEATARAPRYLLPEEYTRPLDLISPSLPSGLSALATVPLSVASMSEANYSDNPHGMRQRELLAQADELSTRFQTDHQPTQHKIEAKESESRTQQKSHLLWKLQLGLQLTREGSLFQLFNVYCDYHNSIQVLLTQAPHMWEGILEGDDVITGVRYESIGSKRVVHPFLSIMASGRRNLATALAAAKLSGGGGGGGGGGMEASFMALPTPSSYAQIRSHQSFKSTNLAPSMYGGARSGATNAGDLPSLPSLGGATQAMLHTVALYQDMMAHPKSGISAILDLALALLSQPSIKALNVQELRRLFCLLFVELRERVAIFEQGFLHLEAEVRHKKDALSRTWLEGALAYLRPSAAVCAMAKQFTAGANFNALNTATGSFGAGMGSPTTANNATTQLGASINHLAASKRDMSLGATHTNLHHTKSFTSKSHHGLSSAWTDNGGDVAYLSNAAHRRRPSSPGLELPENEDAPPLADGALTKTELAAEELSAVERGGGIAPRDGPTTMPALAEVRVWFNLVQTLHVTGVPTLKVEYLLDTLAVVLAGTAAPVELPTSGSVCLTFAKKKRAVVEHMAAPPPPSATGVFGTPLARASPIRRRSTLIRPTEKTDCCEHFRMWEGLPSSLATAGAGELPSCDVPQQQQHPAGNTTNNSNKTIPPIKATVMDLSLSLFALDALGHDTMRVHRDFVFSLQEVVYLLRFAATLCRSREEEDEQFREHTVNYADTWAPGTVPTGAITNGEAINTEVEQLVLYFWEVELYVISIHQLHDFLRERAPELYRQLREHHTKFLTGKNCLWVEELFTTPFFRDCLSVVSMSEEGGTTCATQPPTTVGILRHQSSQPSHSQLPHQPTPPARSLSTRRPTGTMLTLPPAHAPQQTPTPPEVKAHNEYMSSDVQRRYPKNFFIMAVCHESLAQLKESEAVSLWAIREKQCAAVSEAIQRRKELARRRNRNNNNNTVAALSQAPSFTTNLVKKGKPQVTNAALPGYHLNERINPLLLPECAPPAELLRWLKKQVVRRAKQHRMLGGGMRLMPRLSVTAFENNGSTSGEASSHGVGGNSSSPNRARTNSVAGTEGGASSPTEDGDGDEEEVEEEAVGPEVCVLLTIPNRADSGCGEAVDTFFVMDRHRQWFHAPDRKS